MSLAAKLRAELARLGTTPPDGDARIALMLAERAPALADLVEAVEECTLNPTTGLDGVRHFEIDADDINRMLAALARLKEAR